MKDPVYGEISPMAFCNAVSEILVRLPLVSKRAGHQHLFGVVKHYMHPEVLEGADRQAAAAFIMDFIANDTANILERWGPVIAAANPEE
jgi:hypothetical protein